MSALLRGNIRMAWASIKSTRWRSSATMFGIVVAVVPVLTILSIGEGVKRQIVEQVKSFGSDVMLVRPGEAPASEGAAGLQEFWQPQAYGTFTENDVKALRQKPAEIGQVAPLLVVPGKVEGDDSQKPVPVVATTANFLDVTHYDVQYGDFFEEADGARRLAVLGRHAAETLFEGDASASVGRVFEFREETFIVGGVLERLNTPNFGGSVDINEAIIISQQQAHNLADNTAIYQLLIRPADSVPTARVKRLATLQLIESRGGQQDFYIATQAETLDSVNRILTLLATLVGGIASISLIVAGIGITNIMLVNVTERMHEIGIRKAIGATRRQIAGQFMSEAAVLATGGALVGVAMSYLVMYILRVTTQLQPVITWQAAVFVAGLAIVIGVLFSVIPAVKAASKDPIAALRHE